MCVSYTSDDSSNCLKWSTSDSDSSVELKPRVKKRRYVTHMSVIVMPITFCHHKMTDSLIDELSDNVSFIEVAMIETQVCPYHTGPYPTIIFLFDTLLGSRIGALLLAYSKQHNIPMLSEITNTKRKARCFHLSGYQYTLN